MARHRKEFRGLDLPDVPGQVFAPTENHATFTIASALEGFSRGRAVTFVNTGRAREERGRVVMGY